MTIVKPNRSLKSISFFLLLGILVIGGGTVYIFRYNKLVDTRHGIRTAKKDIAREKVENADLKNTLFNITDPVKFKNLAEENSLILEEKPDYLSLSSDSISKAGTD